MRQKIPEREKNLLFLKSGGICAFPGCGKNLIESGQRPDDDSIVADVAHIVADSRQGPRGDVPMNIEDRSKHTNFILLCKIHHKIIDDQPRTHSVAVLRQMKADHEARIAKAINKSGAEPPLQFKYETIHSTLLPVTHLPQAVFSAQCAFSKDSEVKERINYPQNRFELTPFILRDGKLFAFHNLKLTDNPFATVIDQRRVERHRATEMWRDAEDKRRYIAILNRSLHKLMGRYNVRYDPDHKRYYFPPGIPGQERKVTYRSLNRERQELNVVWQPRIRATGEAKNFWYHRAARLHFHQAADLQWCLAIRPERHITKDSITPLESDQIGRKVTKVKARMYNDKYLAEVVFWRDFLSQGRPRFILNFGAQAALVEVQLVTFDVNWIGIPGDDMPFVNQVYDEDLFTIVEQQEAVSGEEIDWNESDEIDEKEDDEA